VDGVTKRKLTAAQKARANKRSRDWYFKNKERVRKTFAAWYEKNKSLVIERAMRWRDDNKDRYNKNQSAWRNLVSEKRCEQSSLRRTLTKRQKPSWANDFFISEAYHLAKIRSKATGIKWHVDHIVPLKSKLVCGLHVEHNLNVIPGSENVRKQNLYWPDMP
jgi:hypothetical protein